MLDFLTLPYWRHKEKLAHKHEQEIKEKCELAEKKLDKISNYRFRAWVTAVRAQKELSKLKADLPQSDLGTEDKIKQVTEKLVEARHNMGVSHAAKKNVLAERERLLKELDAVQQELTSISVKIKSLEKNSSQ